MSARKQQQEKIDTKKITFDPKRGARRKIADELIESEKTYCEGLYSPNESFHPHM